KFVKAEATIQDDTLVITPLVENPVIAQCFPRAHATPNDCGLARYLLFLNLTGYAGTPWSDRNV
ncbi:MAG: hypothetical protein WCP55_04130, partial [Lentisphaerota bacterium]